MNNERNDFNELPKEANPAEETTASSAEQYLETAAASSGEEQGETPAAYYAYGPYRTPQVPGDSEPGSLPVSQDQVTPGVDVTPPRPLRPITMGMGGENGGGSFGGGMAGGQASGGWAQVPRKRGSSFKSVFAAFMAGVIVVGGLMWAADSNNWFTGLRPFSSGGSTQVNGSAGSGTSGGENAGVTKTSFDSVLPGNISSIVEQSSPAVVWIESYAKPKQSGSNPLLSDPFFRQFFGDQFSNQAPKNSDKLQQQGMGTGFIFDKAGYILTNQHVIDGADQVKVKATVNGKQEEYIATVLGTSYDLDLAALKIDAKTDLPTLPIGNADNMKVGDWVIAIGNPYGLDHSVTVGVFSAKGREFSIPDSSGTRNYKNLMQTDAAINPGNSGGPLLNTKGEVIGINTAVSSQAQGIGFAIPSTTINSVVDNLKNNVQIPKEPAPYIGVQLDNVKQEWLQELKLDNTDGAIVADVVRKSPAFQAGIRPYDVIVDLNGEKVKDATELTTKVKAFKVNDTITVGIMRDGKKMDISVKIGDKNENANMNQ